MEPRLKKRLLHYLRWTGALLLISVALAGLAMGVSILTGTTSAKTLWDWTELLLLPILAVGGILFLYRSQREIERRRLTVEQEIARGNQQESALQAYVDRMSELLIKEKLSRFSGDEVRNVARLRTMTLLRGLNAERKRRVLLFLKESGLIEREAVVDLCGADFRGIPVPYANLSRTNLAEANLSEADLHGARLGNAYLSGTVLSKADLHEADLSGADLFSANLAGADLSRANLSGANLIGADLSGCRLDGADLSQADLSGVNLETSTVAGKQVVKSELEKARSLEGAILPDGTKHK